MIHIGKILVPTKFDELSHKALRYGKTLASAFGAELHLLHVVDDPILFAPTTDVSFREQLETECREKLQKLLTSEEQVQLKAKLAVRDSSASDGIVQYARDEEIELIVLGTKGRTPMARILLGSVADHVLREAPCPVLSVRERENDFVTED